MLRRLNVWYFIQFLILSIYYLSSRGAVTETYLAEEAIGLAKSLDWTIITGPAFGKKGKANIPEPIDEMPDQVNLTDGEYLKIGSVIKGVFYVLLTYVERWCDCW
jgi:hypothetical protein